VAPQLIPAGFEVTVPLPAPGLFTVRVKVGVGSKVAATVVAAFHGHHAGARARAASPLQPENVDPPAGAAVSVTTVPLL